MVTPIAHVLPVGCYIDTLFLHWYFQIGPFHAHFEWLLNGHSTDFTQRVQFSHHKEY